MTDPVEQAGASDRPGWQEQRVSADELAHDAEQAHAGVIGARIRAKFAAALYDTLCMCVCGAPIPVVEKPLIPVARTYLKAEHDGKPVRIVAGLMPLGPFIREPEAKRSALVDRFGDAILSAPADPVATEYAALFDDNASEEDKRAAFEHLDAHHPLGRPFRLALNQRAHMRCFRCGGSVGATTPNMGRPGEAAEALMRAARGEPEQPPAEEN